MVTIDEEKHDCRQSVELQIKSNNIICYLNAPISPESNEEEIFTGNSIIRWRGGSHKPRLQSG